MIRPSHMNGMTMEYRSMQSQRAVDLIQGLLDRYRGVSDYFFSVDNISSATKEGPDADKGDTLEIIDYSGWNQTVILDDGTEVSMVYADKHIIE